MEWPRPLPPNVQLVGALLPTPAQPLPPQFQVCCRAAPLLFLVWACMHAPSSLWDGHP
jgi:hypothetical protein